MNTKYLHLVSNLMIYILVAISCTTSCTNPPSDNANQDYWPAQTWRNSPPEAQGMDSEILAQMFETIAQDQIRLHSLLIVRNGYLVTEAYWEPYTPEDEHTVQSITKSVVGTLVGIAIDQGTLAGVDQKILDFFPERKIQNLDQNKRPITLQNLLSMTPGLTCQDLSSAAQGMYRAEDWIQYLLDLPASDTPGTRWIYCSGAAHLLSAILQNATGMDARSYANTNLFEPLGIPLVQEDNWPADPQGVSNGIASLYLTPRDLAKYGYLYLNQGNWNGRQVVPARWVQDSTREQAYIGKDDYVGGLDRRFGYFWSIFPDLDYYGYLGMAGQELFILPEEQMVLVFTGALQVGKEANLLRLVNDYIIPATRSGQPLPSNSLAFSRLEALIQAASGSEQPVPALPQTAQTITGKSFLLDQNPLGWKQMTFFFQLGSAEGVLRINGSQDMQIGLDNRYRLTEVPDSRPVGLRGRWDSQDEFHLDYLIQGEFIESKGQFKFDGNQLTLTITNLNYGNLPLVLHGEIMP